MNIKNIIFTADNNYMQHLAVTLISLLENNKNSVFKIYIFNNDISKSNKENIESIASKYNCSLVYIHFDVSLFKHIDAGRFSIATYYRLLIPEYIDVDKALYLDVDMVVNDSIDMLYNTDVSDVYVAAVEDAWKQREYLNKLGMSSFANYFNAGVLLINLKKWREEKLFKKFIDYEKASTFPLVSHDQDIFNAIFNGKWKKLPLKYNQYEKNPDLDREKLLTCFSEEEIREAQENPVIIHYIGGRKPWHYRSEHNQKSLYWKYLALTPYKGYQPSDKTLRNIISKNTPAIIRNPKRYFKSLFGN
ncbi:glycosyltransferase family 8 protein [Sulfurimonas sp.]